MRERKPSNESKLSALSNWESRIAIDGDGEVLEEWVWSEFCPDALTRLLDTQMGLSGGCLMLSLESRAKAKLETHMGERSPIFLTWGSADHSF